MDELKACPFCGGNDLDVRDEGPSFSGHRYHVACGDCWAKGPLTQEQDKAAEEWNTRPGEDAKLKEVVFAAWREGYIEENTTAHLMGIGTSELYRMLDTEGELDPEGETGDEW